MISVTIFNRSSSLLQEKKKIITIIIKKAIAALDIYNEILVNWVRPE